MRSLLFKEEMYNAAAVYKTKTVTRRTGLLEKVVNKEGDWNIIGGRIDDKGFFIAVFEKSGHVMEVKSRYKIGEILYLAEPMWVQEKEDENTLDIETGHQYIYKESRLSAEEEVKLKIRKYKKVSPMFMKQVFARDFIKMTGITCERLHCITDEGAVLEGIEPFNNIAGMAKIRYLTLFDKINGAGSERKNPFVFVYTFEYLPNFNRRLHAQK